MEELITRITIALEIHRIHEHLLMQEAMEECESVVVPETEQEMKDYCVKLLDGGIDICYNTASEVITAELKNWFKKQEG